jgi:DNA-binding SARP family transcriptional activator
MLIARVSPPVPDPELPRQLSLQPSVDRRLFEIVTRPGGLLVRRLAADLADMGYEVAWARPMPFEVDSGSLGALLLTALATARRSSSRGNDLLVVVEAPTAPQAETIVGQLLARDALGVSAPCVVLVMDGERGTCACEIDSILLEVPSWPPSLARGLVPERGGQALPLQQLSRAADGLADLINGVLRSLPQLGAAELASVVAKTRGPAALTRVLASSILSDASPESLAALEMSARLGYAHARFRALEPAVARSAGDPWWVPLTAEWLQVNLVWREALVAESARAASLDRSACLSRLVADLVDEGAVHEAIDLCMDAGWHGLAADLLAGEAERLVSSGRNATLARWLVRLPAEETRSHAGLLTFAGELQRDDRAGVGQRVLREPATPSPPRRFWSFHRLRYSTGDVGQPSLPPGVAEMPPRRAGDSARADSRNRAMFDMTLKPGLLGHASVRPGAADLLGAQAQLPPGQASAAATPGSRIGEVLGARPGAGTRDVTGRLRVDARLLGPFELNVEGQPVRRWRGNRGRMLLAYLLLHRARPVHRDALGGVFWPEATSDVARNRLHVALYGLRRDLRAVNQHPIVVHSQNGFSFHPDIALWLDIEAFGVALCAARGEEASQREVALRCYETALELYRGDLLEDAPFEEWALLEREQLRVQYLETLDRIAKMRFELGRYAGCIEVCQRLATGDPCREDVHRLLMRCYARLNKPHLAVHQYHQCERQLRDEVGLKPAEATWKLYQQIRRRQLV